MKSVTLILFGSLKTRCYVRRVVMFKELKCSPYYQEKQVWWPQKLETDLAELKINRSMWWREQEKWIQTQQSISSSASMGDLWQSFPGIYEWSCPWRCLSKSAGKFLFSPLCDGTEACSVVTWQSLFCADYYDDLSQEATLQGPVQFTMTPSGKRNEIWLTQPTKVL